MADVFPFWFSYGIGLFCFKFGLIFEDGPLHYLRYKKFYRFLKQSQWWSQEALKKYQNEQLSMLISHAYEHVPYYRNLLNSRKLSPNDFKTAEDLKKIPILTKEILRKNFNFLISEEFPKRNLSKRQYLGCTSGSTGSPLFFLKDRKLSFRLEIRFTRFLRWRAR